MVVRVVMRVVGVMLVVPPAARVARLGLGVGAWPWGRCPGAARDPWLAAGGARPAPRGRPGLRVPRDDGRSGRHPRRALRRGGGLLGRARRGHVELVALRDQPGRSWRRPQHVRGGRTLLEGPRQAVSEARGGADDAAAPVRRAGLRRARVGARVHGPELELGLLQTIHKNPDSVDHRDDEEHERQEHSSNEEPLAAVQI
mmetsp:Transcript_99298/g.258914  ORF Transcript_99298/g.258914 Transcript_99298/m.258914 type:complete len:200 (+) Transcript_99298:873-1472(+)